MLSRRRTAVARKEAEKELIKKHVQNKSYKARFAGALNGKGKVMQRHTCSASAACSVAQTASNAKSKV